MLKRIFNGYILNPGDEPYFGEVIVLDDKILYAGKEKYTPSEPYSEQIDARGGVIMPSFKNCHTHSAMTLFRSFADDMPLKEWLFDKIFPLEAKLTPEDVYNGAKLAALEYIAGGVTIAADMYFQPEQTANALNDCGMRVVIVGAAMGTEDIDNILDKAERAYNTFKNYSPLCSAKLGIHAEYTVSDELIKGMAALAQKYRAGVCVHLAETKKETDDCVNRSGVSPAKKLSGLGLFDFGGDAYHCVYLSDADTDILKEKNVTIVTNPASNLKLASGIAPLKEYFNKGLNVAIGTDGAASNNALDMFREMYLASVLQKVKYLDAKAVGAGQILKAATLNGSVALNLGSGKIQADQIADLIILSLDEPNMQPVNNIANNIVYAGGVKNVKLTMCAGKILYRDGQFHSGINAEEIYRNANASIQRIKAEV